MTFYEMYYVPRLNFKFLSDFFNLRYLFIGGWGCLWGTGEVAAGENICCSCRRPGFRSWHSHGGLQPSIIQVLGNLVSFSDLLGTKPLCGANTYMQSKQTALSSKWRLSLFWKTCQQLLVARLVLMTIRNSVKAFLLLIGALLWSQSLPR